MPQGTGSGFIWDDDGHVVTNFHVIRGAQNLQVTLADQSVYDASVVGIDPDRDLAVVKVDAPKVSECGTCTCIHSRACGCTGRLARVHHTSHCRAAALHGWADAMTTT